MNTQRKSVEYFDTMFAQATTIKLSLAIQSTISESVIVDEEDQNFYEKIVNKS